MFTGIVERTAEVEALEDRPGSRRITLGIDAREGKRWGLPPWKKAALGESISLNGVCLTVVGSQGARGAALISFDAVPETLRRTTLGALRKGDRVNLERSLAVGDPFGGHYVTGHADGVGFVRSRRAEGDQVLFEIGASRELIRQVIPKGSIAIDGVSLTVIDVDREASWLSFAAIPHTLERTALAQRAQGSAVNVETDAFGKWVLHAIDEETRGHTKSEPLASLLERCGFKGP